MTEPSSIRSSSATTVLPPVEPSRLLPRVSVRGMFAATFAAALIAAMIRTIGGGGLGVIAAAILSALAFLAAMIILMAVIFLLAFLTARLWYAPDDEASVTSPFAEDRLPDQILPPQNPV